MNRLISSLEFKFGTGAAQGEFEGYAAVFGTRHASGDTVVPGAFKAGLAERKAAGRLHPPMYANHGWRLGGPSLPIGVWNAVDEDDKGLAVAGRISGMETEFGRQVFALVKDNALSRLSIGYRIRPGGVKYGKKPEEPKRTLSALDLFDISLVDDGDDPGAALHSLKSADLDAALNWERLTEHLKSMRDDIDPLQIRELEDLLRDAGASRSKAVAMASVFAKVAQSESEGTKSAAETLRAFAAGIGG